VDRIRYWIESGAAYPGTYAALGGGAIGGYYANGQVQTDHRWPETKAAGEAMKRRCGACHKGPRSLPRALADENGVSFWRPNWRDPRLRRSRHIVFNLSRPAKSLVLLVPLARPAGGYAEGAPADLTRPSGRPLRHKVVFETPSDADYQKILAAVRRGKKTLEEIKRFDMPGFRPPAPYFRELKRYGILSASFDPARDPADPYALDQAYWRSLWWQPVGK